jgi:hypothetical protein
MLSLLKKQFREIVFDIKMFFASCFLPLNKSRNAHKKFYEFNTKMLFISEIDIVKGEK